MRDIFRACRYGLPGDASSTPSTPPKGLRLTIEVNDVGVVSVFTHNGPNKTLEQRIASSLDKPISNQLQRILRPIKAQFPSETTATLLVHDQVPYNTLIEVMDATRTTRRIVNGQRISVGLFPDIAIGSLPEPSTATSNAQYLNESGGVSG